MKLKYQGPHASVQIAATGQTVVRGETVDVKADVARQLVKQASWVKVQANKEKESSET
jgi:predicted acyltransferase (DUF342 family)